MSPGRRTFRNSITARLSSSDSFVPYTWPRFEFEGSVVSNSHAGAGAAGFGVVEYPSFSVSYSREPRGNFAGRASGAVSRSHMFATEPLFRYGAVAQIPASGFAGYTRPPFESGYLSASASVLRMRGAGRRGGASPFARR